MSDPRPTLPGDSLIPIRTISSLTGVNPVTLRAWERRYKLLKPTRTPKGHRLYTMGDVELIRKVVTLLAGGMSIGQVPAVVDAGPVDAPDSAATVDSGAGDSWAHYRQRLLHGIAQFDEESISDTYNDVLSLYPIDIITSRLIVPVLEELGRLWEQGGPGRIAEEHFFSVFLRNKLGARFHHRSRSSSGPCLVAACLPGEQHEVGLLLFALIAQDWDYSIIMLGANTPLPEIVPVVNRVNANGVILAGGDQPSTELLESDLPALVESVGLPVFVGGRIAKNYPEQLAKTGATLLDYDLHCAMREVNALLLNTR